MSIFKEGMTPHEKDVAFAEAATTGEFPSLLREDYEDILLSAYNEAPPVLLPLCRRVTSNKEVETYRGMNIIQDQDNVIPEGSEYPEIMLSEKSTVSITNRKYGGIVSVTDEMIRYNKMAEFDRLAAMEGEALARTVESKIASMIETTTNTTAYGSTLTLTRANIELMATKFKQQTATAADASTVNLNLAPDTLLIPEDLEFDARRIMNSTLIPGSANNDVNVMKSAYNVVVCQQLSSASVFYLLKARWANGAVFQSVVGPPPETFIQSMDRTQSADSTFRYDKINFKARLIFGVGVLDTKWCLRSIA